MERSHNSTHGEYACRTKSGGGGAKRGGSRKLPSASAARAAGATSPARCPACVIMIIIPGWIGRQPLLHTTLALARQAMEGQGWAVLRTERDERKVCNVFKVVILCGRGRVEISLAGSER